MVRTRYSLVLCLAAIALAGSACQYANAAPSETPKTAPMDLTTGRTNAVPLTMDGSEAFFPQSPPQTVEGVLLSVDRQGAFATVRTLRDGDVKIGLPPNLYISRDGQMSTLDAMKPGDRVYATVVTNDGVRAIRLVSEGPPNPLANIIGIPVLCIIALGIWRIRWTTARSAGKS